jgi:hypothetical protein
MFVFSDSSFNHILYLPALLTGLLHIWLAAEYNNWLVATRYRFAAWLAGCQVYFPCIWLDGKSAIAVKYVFTRKTLSESSVPLQPTISTAILSVKYASTYGLEPTVYIWPLNDQIR